MTRGDLPYGAGSVIYISRNTQHPYCARRYRGKNKNGNPSYTTLGCYATEEEAVQVLLDHLEWSEEDLRRANMTFREVFEHYVGNHDDLAESTLKLRKGTAKKYCGQLMDMRFQDVRADDMREAIRLAQTTIVKREVKTLLSLLDREAELLDIPGKRYAQFLDPIRRKAGDTRPDREAFTEKEMQRFLKHRNEKDMYLVLFLCYTGFRQGAFRTIRKENVDLENMIVTGGIKTQAGIMRQVPIHPVIQPFVRRMMRQPGELLLTDGSGGPMKEIELNMRYQMAVAPYVDRHFVPHECRHSFRTKLDDAKVDETVKCALMGHEMPTAGQRYYTRISIEKKREAILQLWEEDPAILRGRGQYGNLEKEWWKNRDSSSTFRQLYDDYLRANPHKLTKELLSKFERSIGNLKAVMDIQYQELTDAMLDNEMQKIKSDFVKTKMAFLIHEFDRAAGMKHTLAFDTAAENQEGGKRHGDTF
ncbi:MAG: tyrosine-type recombinase/integrase [Lachnospiraceae bacterium]|nr:tyrosine-type recombinase/integrase [Lachnospiraceae bacterium]